MGEGQGFTLCKEGRDLVFQYSVRYEETKVLNNLSNLKVYRVKQYAKSERW